MALPYLASAARTAASATRITSPVAGISDQALTSFYTAAGGSCSQALLSGKDRTAQEQAQGAKLAVHGLRGHGLLAHPLRLID